MTLAAALLMTITAVALLLAAWCARRRGRPGARYAGLAGGWGLLALSLVPWCLAGGADRGVALAILAAMVAAFALLSGAAWQGARKPRRRRNERERPANGLPGDATPLVRFARRAAIFLLAGPVAFTAAMIAALDLYAGTPHWSDANRLAAALLLVPILWSVLAILATYDARLRVRGVAVLGVLALGLAALFLLPGGAA